MLRSAIHNLIDNAAKYAPQGSRILVRATTNDGMVGIAVLDQGPGIPLSHQDAIFADYVRAEPSPGQEGLGLGLAFVKKITELHQGWIELIMDAKQGPGFCLWLPGHREEEKHDRAGDPQKPFANH